MPLSKLLVWMLALLMSISPIVPAQGRRSASAPPPRDPLAGVIEELLKSPITIEEWRELTPADEDTSSGESGKDAEEKAPPDDAPIDELFAFWQQRNYDEDVKGLKLSDRVRERLLAACEDRPQRLFSVYNLLPDTPETHDRIYKLYEAEADNHRNLKGLLHSWLMYNSRYFREDLLAQAAEIGRPMPYQSGELEALARLDWEAARPLLERAIAAQRLYHTGVALGLLYDKAVAEGDGAKAEALRARMKAYAVDPGMDVNSRSRVLESLMKTDWEGQREWFLALFSNSAVNGIEPEEAGPPSSRGIRARVDFPHAKNVGPHNFGNLLAAILLESPDKWLSVVSAFVDGGDRTLHLAAVRALTPFIGAGTADLAQRKEAARRLLPWMTDPAWAPLDERSSYIFALVGLKMPETLAGAIWILEHDESADLRATAADLAGALADPQAAPALRRALEREKSESNRGAYIEALAKCRGFSDDEVAAAIEAYARMKATGAGVEKIAAARWDDAAPALPMGVSIGRGLHETNEIPFTEGLAIRLIERARALRATQPAVARELFAIVQVERLPVVRADLVDRIGRGWVDLAGVQFALANRGELRKHLDSELHALDRQGGAAAGLAAVILSDETRQRELLRGEDARAKTALLAAARFMRDRLPVDRVGALLPAADRTVSAAAEIWLEFEDSPEARSLILARHPGEARILGEKRQSYETPEMAVSAEEALRREVREQKGLDAVFAIVPSHSGSRGSLGSTIIRVRGGRAEISLYSTEGRRRVRWLTDAEFGELISFTARQEVEDLPAELRAAGTRNSRTPQEVACEYLRLTRDGGRRILLSDLRPAPRRDPTLHEELAGLFHRLGHSGEYRTRYAIEEKIPGVEVLFADGDQYVEGICGEGTELRIRVREARKESDELHPLRRARQGGEAQWRVFNGAQPGSVVDPPRACRMIESLPVLQGANGPLVLMAPTRVGDAVVFTSIGPEPAVWIARPGADPVRIAEGALNFPILTPDGQWLVGNRLGETTTGSNLVRRDMKTGREFPVEVADSPEAVPIAWLEAHGKILLGGRYSGGRGDYSLLDPATGAMTVARGEFRPLLDQANGRPLQPTGAPNEFWAALFDREKGATVLGRYDTKRFAFAPVLALPELPIHNAQLWVQGTNAWIVYQGDLLRVPLPAK
ncbi:MAG: hypothetical protein SF339_22445 [Blastocatellia bacterium]|nr:hypothetical protein [Blastocatellia bacterium]